MTLELYADLHELGFVWTICCFVSILAIFNHLNQFKVVSEIFSIIVVSFKTVYPFLFVILMNYWVFATIGMFIFGGNINSETIQRMQSLDIDPGEGYENFNWNDLANSFVMLYSISLNNNLLTYINMSIVGDGPIRNYKGLFFLSFYLANNLILQNIFIGQVIEIGITYLRVTNQEFKNVRITGSHRMTVDDDTDINETGHMVRIKVD